MLDFFGTVALTAGIVLCIAIVVAAIPDRIATKVSIALIAGLWVGLQLALANGGALVGNLGPAPAVGVMVLSPVIATAFLTALLPGLRDALLAVPSSVLAGLNAGRVFGAFFLLLAAQNRLGGPFPYFAGWGDVITGILAVPVAIMLARGAAAHSNVPFYWNLFGTLDLVVAVGLGVMSANGSPLQIFFPPTTGPSALTGLPWSLIPTVLVPFYLIVHAILFAQLRHAATRPVARAA
jgi:hypothetical protein